MPASLDIQKDGFVKGSQLEFILDQMTDAIAEALEARDEMIADLRRELDTERRLRLSAETRMRRK